MIIYWLIYLYIHLNFNSFKSFHFWIFYLDSTFTNLNSDSIPLPLYFWISIPIPFLFRGIPVESMESESLFQRLITNKKKFEIEKESIYSVYCVYGVRRFRILNISFLLNNKILYWFMLSKNAVDLWPEKYKFFSYTKKL